MPWLHVAIITLLCLTQAVCAQFQFFEQMFGHGHQQQQQQQRGPSTSQWTANADIVPCSQYLCPETLVCVSNPGDCPCPDVQDIKCLIPDTLDKGSATVLCVRGNDGCAEAEQLARRR